MFKKQTHFGFLAVVMAFVISTVGGLVAGLVFDSPIVATNVMVWVTNVFLMFLLAYFAEWGAEAMVRIFGPDSAPDPFIQGPITMIQNYLRRKYGEE